MKFALVLGLLFAVSAHAQRGDSRCGMPQGSPCHDFYNRFDAFKKLQAAENSLDDATGNLDLVERFQKSRDLNLEYVTDNFLFIQEAVGGAGSTSDARASFELVAQESSEQNRLDELATAFVRISRAENSVSDSQGDFSVVMKYVRTGQIGIRAASQMFLEVLQISGGSGNTSDARSSYQLLMSHHPRFGHQTLLNSFRALVQSENSMTDAIGDFELVVVAAEKCNDLNRATQDFVDVLNSVGGSGSTSDARALYSKLYGI